MIFCPKLFMQHICFMIIYLFIYLTTKYIHLLIVLKRFNISSLKLFSVIQDSSIILTSCIISTMIQVLWYFQCKILFKSHLSWRLKTNVSFSHQICLLTVGVYLRLKARFQSSWFKASLYQRNSSSNYYHYVVFLGFFYIGIFGEKSFKLEKTYFATIFF